MRLGAASSAGVMLVLDDDGEAKATPAAAASPTKPGELTVAGTFTVDAAASASIDDSCWTDGGYDDIEIGTQVVVRDRDGSTLAIGQLGRPEWDGLDCAFPFVVSGVPAGKGIYRIEVSHRGELEYTEDRIQTHLELELG